MEALHIWIKSVIDSDKSLSQKGLARAMGLNPAAINRMLHGARKIKVDELSIIEAYLGQNYDAPGRALPPLRLRDETYASMSNVIGQDVTGLDNRIDMARTIPVYGCLDEAAAPDVNLDDDDPIDWVVRHPGQSGIHNAFAIYVFSSDMKPRYFPGELIYIHPGRPPESGKDCVIKAKDGQIFIRKYIDREGDNFHVRQYNPPQDDILKRADISEIYTVIGRG